MATSLNKNLLKNAGGDAAAGTTGDTIVPIPHWTTTGSFTAVAYGDSNYDVPEPKGGGKNFFAGGPGDPLSTASQTINFSGLTDKINAGDVTAKLSALLGGYSSQDDFMTVTVTFFDQENAPIGNVLTITGPDAAQRKDTTELLARKGSIVVPAGAAGATVEMTSTREQGSDNDGYADKLALKLFVNTPAISASAIGASPMTFAAPAHPAGSAHIPTTPLFLAGSHPAPAAAAITTHGGIDLAISAHAGTAATIMANLIGHHLT